MIRLLLAFLASALVSLASQAGEWPANVTRLTLPAPVNGAATVSVEGSIKGGTPFLKHEDLTWAANSSMACFVAPAFDHFLGTHVFYSVALPSYSEMTIRVKPKDGKDINFYAYSVGAISKGVLPPQIQSCVSCEAGPETNGGNVVAGEEKRSLRAVKNPYEVLIGVAGSKGLQEGDFTLTVDLKTRK